MGNDSWLKMTLNTVKRSRQFVLPLPWSATAITLPVTKTGLTKNLGAGGAGLQALRKGSQVDGWVGRTSLSAAGWKKWQRICAGAGGAGKVLSKVLVVALRSTRRLSAKISSRPEPWLAEHRVPGKLQLSFITAHCRKLLPRASPSLWKELSPHSGLLCPV